MIWKFHSSITNIHAIQSKIYWNSNKIYLKFPHNFGIDFSFYLVWKEIILIYYQYFNEYFWCFIVKTIYLGTYTQDFWKLWRIKISFLNIDIQNIQNIITIFNILNAWLISQTEIHLHWALHRTHGLPFFKSITTVKVYQLFSLKFK
jgi:hypothetical protein